MDSQLRDVPSAVYTDEAIREMWRHVNEGVTDTETIAQARKVAKTVPARDRKAIAAALLQHTKDTIHFVNDPIGVETVGGIPWLRSVGAGDCDEMCTYLAAHAEAVGIPARFVTIKGSQPKHFDHVYCQLNIDGKWLGADPVVKDSYLGWEPPRYYAKKFWPRQATPISDVVMGEVVSSRRRNAMSMGDINMKSKRGKLNVSGRDPFLDEFEFSPEDVLPDPNFGVQEAESIAAIPDAPAIAAEHGKAVGEAEGQRKIDREDLKRTFKAKFAKDRKTWEKAVRTRKGSMPSWQKRIYTRKAYIIDRDIAEANGIQTGLDEVGVFTVQSYETATKVQIVPTDGSTYNPRTDALVSEAEVTRVTPKFGDFYGAKVAAQIQAEVEDGKVAPSRIAARVRELAAEMGKKALREVAVVVESRNDIDDIMGEAASEVANEKGWRALTGATPPTVRPADMIDPGPFGFSPEAVDPVGEDPLLDEWAFDENSVGFDPEEM